MEHSIALVTGATFGVGYATARALAGEGRQEIIVTERSQEHAQETAAQLAAETKMKVFTPLELNLDKPSSVQCILDELVKRGRPVDFLELNGDMAPSKRVTTASVEAAQAPVTWLSSIDCWVTPCQPARFQRSYCHRRFGSYQSGCAHF